MSLSDQMDVPHVVALATASEHPPAVASGPVAWARRNLFRTWYDTLLTLLIVGLALYLLPAVISWTLVDAVWVSDTPRRTPAEVVAACRAAAGACWAFIEEKRHVVLFGLYPYGEEWRPTVATGLLVGLALASTARRFWGRTLLAAWAVGIVVGVSLMYGAVPLGFVEIPLVGLSIVETRYWGGLPLTIGLSVIGLVLAFPLSILLALGRRSELPAVRTLCVTYIELFRGVPLITVLFMAAVLFPLFLPEGWNFDHLLRAQIALGMFTAAYLAEAIRGGLQALPNGQSEAAESLGLTYWQKNRLVILPQVLRISIPALVNTFIGCFMDTTLVIMVGLFDILGSTRLGLADLVWSPLYKEAYIFVCLVFFVLCFSMSRYSQFLETHLNASSRSGGQ